MKTRNGLVSNSSSSSFIVHYINSWCELKFKNIKLLTKEQESILKKNGYKLCECAHPSHIEYNTDGLRWITNKKQLSKSYAAGYAKSVTCNQNDEIYFLVKNNIPFIASVHYGHETYLYPKDSKYIFVFHNRGSVAETYHQQYTEDKLSKLVEDLEKQPVAEKILVSQFIKREEKFQVEFKESLENENQNGIS
jgi:Zn ribbon nucleic-acid-binding protein